MRHFSSLFRRGSAPTGERSTAAASHGAIEEEAGCDADVPGAHDTEGEENVSSPAAEPAAAQADWPSTVGDSGTPLHRAAENGDLAAIQALLAGGGDVGCQTRGGVTPLHLAAAYGHLPAMKALLAAGADPNCCTRGGRTPLHSAANNNQAQAIYLLVEEGAQVDSIADMPGRTPLHNAAFRGCTRAVRALIKCGADVNKCDRKGSTPLAQAAYGNDSYGRCVRLLLESSADIGCVEDDGWSPVHLAAQSGNLEALKALLRAGAPANAVEQDGWTPLHIAAREGFAKAARMLIARGADVGALDKKGETPLSKLAQCDFNGRFAGRVGATAQALLDAKADPQAANPSGETPLSLAASRGCRELQDLLSQAVEKAARRGTRNSSGALGSRKGSGAPAIDVRPFLIDFEREVALLRRIGGGSFGEVYMARYQETLVAAKMLLLGASSSSRDSAPGSEGAGAGSSGSGEASRPTVAPAPTLRTLSSASLASLEKEAAVMAALHHDNVVGFRGVSLSPPALIMEHCSRGSLCHVLAEARASAQLAAQLDWIRRLTMVLGAAKGMLHLHARDLPIIHRDLKSPNLLVGANWEVKVSDFNLSKLWVSDEGGTSSSLVGTNPRWMAPEVLAGGAASLMSDVYAFGLVLWELLAWQIPFHDFILWKIPGFVLAGGRPAVPEPQDLPGVDAGGFEGLPDYIALMERCWAQEPGERPPFEEVIHLLRALLKTAVDQARARGPRRRATAS